MPDDMPVDEFGNVETSYYQPDEPEEQVNERKSEEGKVREGIRLLEEVIKRMEERIAYYDSVDSIAGEVQRTPEEFMRAVAANAMTKANLINEKEYLVSLRDTYHK